MLESDADLTCLTCHVINMAFSAHVSLAWRRRSVGVYWVTPHLTAEGGNQPYNEELSSATMKEGKCRAFTRCQGSCLCYDFFHGLSGIN